MAAVLESGQVLAGVIPSGGDVDRLLGSVLALAVIAALWVIVRPTWLRVVCLVVADLWWVWIGMDGPTLVSRGTHGIHLGDVPVLVTLPAALTSALRLWLQRRAVRPAP
ncbi:MAG: hypothetical protein H0V07_00505 [Propionibacteriales bacterium]|nr:hypothetical protein [Propionibacteriales bacterium]